MTSSTHVQRPRLAMMQRGICKHPIWIVVLGSLCACWILWATKTQGASTRPMKLVWQEAVQIVDTAAGTTVTQVLPEVHLTRIHSASTSRSITNGTAYGCPLHPQYDNPWVRNNIVLTYALHLRDGLGGQVHRIMGIYAIAKALGLGYVHSPFECVGHLGPLSHYRNETCDSLEPRDQLMLQRVIKYLSLPDTTTVNIKQWKSVTSFWGGWKELALLVERAAEQHQPTVIRLEMMTSFIKQCPDLFHHVPSWRSEWLLEDGSKQSPAVSQPWLLTGVRPVRIAVHMRRGDLADNADHMIRWLPASYYINVVNNVVRILESLNHDYTVEWFTEASDTPEGIKDLSQIRQQIPNLSVHLNTDLLWNWHQMAAADVFVMSLSGYSLVPAVVNSKGIVIKSKSRQACTVGPGRCHPSNWLEAATSTGALSELIVREIHRRWGHTNESAGVPGRQRQQQYHPRVEQQ